MNLMRYSIFLLKANLLSVVIIIDYFSKPIYVFQSFVLAGDSNCNILLVFNFITRNINIL